MAIIGVKWSTDDESRCKQSGSAWGQLLDWEIDD